MRTVRVQLDDLRERYAFLDPAGKRSATQRIRDCRPSINVVAPDALGRVFWLYAWAEKTNTRALIEKVFAVNDYWRPQVFGCESNAMQSLFADAIDIVAELKDRKLPLASVRQPSVIDKDFRIQCVMHPIVGEGRLFVLEKNPQGVKRAKGLLDHMLVGVPPDCLGELTSFPMHPLRDVPDGLASACALIPPRRAATQERSRRAQGRYEREMSQLHGSGDGEENEDVFAELRLLNP